MLSDKPFRTLEELCDILVNKRGLACDDIGLLKGFLAKTNYYRFSGYAREFQVDPRYGDNRFINGSSFESINEVVRLDSKMRLLLMEQLSVIEIAVRALIAHEYGRAYGEKAFYLDANFYHQSDNSKEDRPFDIVKNILSDLSRDKGNMVSRYVDESGAGEDFDSRIRRYANVPIWVAVEVVSFGRISNMISYAKDLEPAKAAAGTLGVQWAPFADVIHSFSVLRNLCAHHRQLWNRRMGILCPVQKKLKPRNIKFDSTSAYCQLLMANHYRQKIDGDTSVAHKIESVLAESEPYSKGFRMPNPK
ncbi:Abi family protein [Adlercreutzia sp. ZJ154]|uniref:Abi family protein n=1 Tax=Adlercreutzia sp. ZJ154 TaxID=2709790 RepID=UPI0013E9A6ED|nr:Abi family protein [Adlercreutzia sp. ZJ154]